MSIVNTTYLNNKSIKTCLTGWKLLWTNRCNKALFPVLLSPTTTMVHLVSLAILVMIRLVCFFHIKTIILFTILVFFHVSKLVSKLEKKCERTSQTYGTATTDGSAVRRVRLSAVPLLCSSAVPCARRALHCVSTSLPLSWMKRLLALLGVASRRVTLWCSSLKKDIFFIDVNFKRDKGDYIFIHSFIHCITNWIKIVETEGKRSWAFNTAECSGVHALSKDYILALSSLA